MLLINITCCGRLRYTACSNSALKLAPLYEIMGNTVFLFLFVSIACILLCDFATPAAGLDVIMPTCSKEQFRDKDKMCSQSFLEKTRQHGVNCSEELKKYKMCYKNFTLECYEGFLNSYPNMTMPMGRVADIKSKMHHFAGMICGMTDGPVNTTGLPDKIKHLLKCKPEFFVEANTCAMAFHRKFEMKMKNSSSPMMMPDLCDSFKTAKMCNADFMKKHCTLEKPPPPPDRFNPFCPNKMDRPDPTAGSSKITITNGILTITSFAFYLLL